ncbi:MAG: hypothetical protein WB711_01630 [Terriglobales bacterium]
MRGTSPSHSGKGSSYTISAAAHPDTSNEFAGDPTCCEEQECPPHYFWVPSDCQCEYASPIIVDTTGKGFRLTSAEDGVVFDIAGDGHPVRIAWTAPDSRNAFLALDRNHNGRIDSGKELFGNFTAQPKSDDPNGFLALAEFDKLENGGNGDGIIDEHDAVFSHLLLWIDENHDGISQPNELHQLSELGVHSLALRYSESRRTDQYGNEFRYKSAINPDPQDGHSKDGRWIYDVFFMVDASPPETAARQHFRMPLAKHCGRGQLLINDRLDLEGLQLDGSPH